MLADYFIVRGRRLSLGDMFLKKESIYWNTYGVNIRAIAAFVCGVAPTLPGFIRNVSAQEPVERPLLRALQVNATLGIPIGAYYAYVATWPVGASTAAAVYVAANLIYPPTPFRMVRSSSSPSFSNEDEKIMDEEDKAKAPAFSTVYSAA
jgi:NCS1 family nucleobase:cation symporter-1